MDDRKFDTLARELGRRNRRGFLKAMLGIGGVAVSGTLVVTDAAAARRGLSGPNLPNSTTTPTPAVLHLRQSQLVQLFRKVLLRIGVLQARHSGMLHQRRRLVSHLRDRAGD